MAATLSPNATKAQALAYLNAQWKGYKYANSASSPYNGKTAAQIYAQLAAQNPTATPYTIAGNVDAIMVSSAFAAGLGQGTTEGTNILGQTANPANYNLDLPSWLAGLTNFAGFLEALGQAHTWIRVAKVAVGGALLIIGLAHMTGADNAVASAARKVPVPI